MSLATKLKNVRYLDVRLVGTLLILVAFLFSAVVIPTEVNANVNFKNNVIHADFNVKAKWSGPESTDALSILPFAFYFDPGGNTRGYRIDPGNDDDSDSIQVIQQISEADALDTNLPFEFSTESGQECFSTVEKEGAVGGDALKFTAPDSSGSADITVEIEWTGTISIRVLVEGTAYLYGFSSVLILYKGEEINREEFLPGDFGSWKTVSAFIGDGSESRVIIRIQYVRMRSLCAYFDALSFAAEEGDDNGGGDEEEELPVLGRPGINGLSATISFVLTNNDNVSVNIEFYVILLYRYKIDNDFSDASDSHTVVMKRFAYNSSVAVEDISAGVTGPTMKGLLTHDCQAVRIKPTIYVKLTYYDEFGRQYTEEKVVCELPEREFEYDPEYSAVSGSIVVYSTADSGLVARATAFRVLQILLLVAGIFLILWSPRRRKRFF